MIITLIGLGLLVVGIILTIIYNKTDNWNIRCRIEIPKFAFILFGAMLTFVASAFIIINTITYDVEYQNMLHTKEMLEYRIEHMEENITGNEMLYNDIVEFNNELRSTKKWANSPWTSWFNNQDIASIDYIDLNDN